MEVLGSPVRADKKDASKRPGGGGTEPRGQGPRKGNPAIRHSLP